MHDGLAILIKRMDTFPDEFIEGWWDAFFQDNHTGVFSEEDQYEFTKAQERLEEYKKERNRRKYTEAVIEAVANISSRDDGIKQYRQKIIWASEEGIVRLKQFITEAVEK